MRPRFFLALLALLAPLAGSAVAQPAREPGVRTLDSILPEIRRNHPGNFYDADGPTPGPGGSEHYHLKWMTPDGRIEWLDTDARTGRVLGASPGRDTFDGPRQERDERDFAPSPGFGRNFRGNDDARSGGEGRGRGAWRGEGRGGYGGGRGGRRRGD